VAAAALFGACSSGSSGCDSGGGSREQSGQSSSFAGGSSSGGGPDEAVSFQKTGMGLRRGVASSTAAVAGSTVAAPGGYSAAVPARTLTASAATPGGAPSAAPSSSGVSGFSDVLCGGFPGLPDDCLGSPQILAVQQKCCPNGVIVACRAIPGGARLSGRGCASAAP